MNDIWPVLSRYDSEHLREIAMPMGGIGTGFFSLGGLGQLNDWQLMSRPHRGWRPMYAHLLVRTAHREKAASSRSERKDGVPRPSGESVKLRVLEGDIRTGLSGDTGAAIFLAGIPRFRDASFEAAYPFGRVLLSDPETPVSAVIEGMNPLIPGDTDASSLPIALLSVTLANRLDRPVDAWVSLLLSNFVGTDGIARDLKDNVTEIEAIDGWRGMRFSKSRADRTPQNGTMSILCDAGEVKVARRWKFRDRPWNGETLGLLDSLLSLGFVVDDDPETPCPPSPHDTWDSSLSAHLPLGPHERKTIRILVTWHFPHRSLSDIGWWSGNGDPIVRNHYAASFEDSSAIARHVLPHLDDLRRRSAAFVESVVSRDAPHALREAALFNLSALRSHTCFRLDDGSFFAFEGCAGSTGCCHGSCTHVWNYEEATVHLFPDLHRSMIETHLKHGMTPGGGQRFRVTLPLHSPDWNGAAADGQMGLIVRIYQQVLADGEPAGREWLKRWIPVVKSMLEFAWAPGGWDADRDGVMEGAQHNTYDVEFFGPNPLGTVWYLAALAAGARMARMTGDGEFAAECDRLRRMGSEWVDERLYNGRYYYQIVRPMAGSAAPMTVMGDEQASATPKFQVGNGCLIDQLVGQYKANRVGLGDLLDRYHLQTAVKSIFESNFRRHFRDHYNNMRTFALNDESGTLICSYPEGGRPDVPFPYWGECMTGFEYQLAVLLLDYGYPNEAVAVTKAVRDRHNGANRNPFNEPECGSFYARCMASWALLDAWGNSTTTKASASTP